MNRLHTVFRPAALVPALLALLFAAGCGTTARTADPYAADPSVVAVIDGQPWTLDAFEARYARAVGGLDEAVDDSLAAYQDFLERYVNFRIKVLAAENVGYDTLSRIQDEVTTYRTSFARPYLLDRAVLNPIIDQLYERGQEMVDASHILIRVDENAGDTLAAYQKISALRDSVMAGADFGLLAVRHSEDPSARGQAGAQGYAGRLGYFSAGRMVEPFETWAYETPVGAASPVFRTQFGYHILYVHDRRPTVRDIRLSHLMVRPGATAEDSAAARATVDSLRTRILAGEDFEALAKTYSDDTMSGQRGGDLGFVRYDNYQLVEPFRSVAFDLAEVGDVSEVVETRFGYHVIKLTDRRAPETLEEQYESLKQTASRLPRTKQAETRLAAEVRARYGAAVDTSALRQAVDAAPQDSVEALLQREDRPAALAAVPAATLGDSTYTLGQIAAVAPARRMTNLADPVQTLLERADAFLNDAAIAYEAAALEQRDDEFRAIMDEFRDGLILFELMGDSVWTPAAEDSAALAAYFEAHRDRYQYGERTRLVEFYSWSDSLLNTLAARAEAGTPLSTLIAEVEADTADLAAVDTVFVEGPTASVHDVGLGLAPGQAAALQPFRNGHLLIFNDGTVPPRPKTLDEARSQVVNDYQTVLEERLVESLRRRYGVRTYPERLTRAFREATDGATASTD